MLQVSTLGVDPGDVYALLVEWCYGQGHAGQALQLLQQMCGRGLHPDAYMDPGMLGAIYQVGGGGGDSVQAGLGGAAPDGMVWAALVCKCSCG